VGAIVTALALMLTAPVTRAFSATNLLSACEQHFELVGDGDPDALASTENGLCLSYITAVIETIDAWKVSCPKWGRGLVCIPRGEKTGRLAWHFVQWGRRCPEQLANRTAAVTVLVALIDTYHCRPIRE